MQPLRVCARSEPRDVGFILVYMFTDCPCLIWGNPSFSLALSELLQSQTRLESPVLKGGWKWFKFIKYFGNCSSFVFWYVFVRGCSIFKLTVYCCLKLKVKQMLELVPAVTRWLLLPCPPFCHWTWSKQRSFYGVYMQRCSKNRRSVRRVV
jgi:hypothetical protein